MVFTIRPPLALTQQFIQEGFPQGGGTEIPPMDLHSVSSWIKKRQGICSAPTSSNPPSQMKTWPGVDLDLVPACNVKIWMRWSELLIALLQFGLIISHSSHHNNSQSVINSWKTFFRHFLSSPHVSHVVKWCLCSRHLMPLTWLSVNHMAAKSAHRGHLHNEIIITQSNMQNCKIHTPRSSAIESM